jgi:hypothetical protein
MKTATWAYWRRILVGNILASLAVVFAFSGATLGTPLFEPCVPGISFLSRAVSRCSGARCPCWRRGSVVRFPLTWIASVVMMACSHAAWGSRCSSPPARRAVAVSPVVSRQRPRDARRHHHHRPFITAYEVTAARRRDAAPCTKERDEAHGG